MKKQALGIVFSLLLLVTFIGAAPRVGAAIFSLKRSFAAALASRERPRPVHFHEHEGRGLLVDVWINDAGPYVFAIDTGAGATIVAPHVAAQARMEYSACTVRIIGLSGRGVAAGGHARIGKLAIGDADNLLPARGTAIIAPLPRGIDGILDPTEAFWPFGYVIDMPAGELRALDVEEPVAPSREATMVRWLPDAEGHRPFVRLANGERALLDTGSGFGLAVNVAAARKFGIELSGDGPPSEMVRDLGGGRVHARRAEPATIALGTMVLRNVPTDLLYGTDAQTPTLLGRAALRPFRLYFYARERWIRIEVPADG